MRGVDREMNHADLIAELPDVEKLPTAERITLAKTRRASQLQHFLERERRGYPPRERRPRLTFASEIELIDATTRSDVDEVRRLLERGANPNSHNEDGLTPLHQCAIDDNVMIMQTLLDYGADVNARDTEHWTPLHAAACCAHLNAVRLLIKHNANLLAVNADGNMPYDICDEEATLDVIEGEMAAQGITQSFIDEQRGAAEKTMLDDMKALHQRGQPLDQRQPDGSTYLHVAAAYGFYDVAAFLLRCGVQPNVRDNDLWTPLHAAAYWAQPDIIDLLCDYGGDINACTNQQETPEQLSTDSQTRGVIATHQQQEAKKKRSAFGVRDSRRQSRRRKKFESPQQAVTAADNLFSARGAIRRLSLRDRSGMTPARLEAQKENTDLIRSWSKEDVTEGSVPRTSWEGSPTKRVLRGAANKPKPMSPDEWLKKLERGGEDEDAADLASRRRGSTRRNGERVALRNHSHSPERKNTCCCSIC